jgi:hypothetical protein
MHETLKIKIDFAKNRQRPAEVFQAMSSYIEAYQAIGQVMVGSLGGNEDFALQLENVETGSVASLLKAVPGRVGEWLEKALFESSLKLAEELSDIDSTSTEEEVDILAQQLESELAKSNIRQMVDPHIDRQAFAHALNKLSEANKKLLPDEKVLTSLSGGNNITPINTHWRFNANPKEMFLGLTVSHNVIDKFYVKSPINIGKGAWPLVSISTDSRYSARISDVNWLENYQNGLIPAIGPKDVIEAEVSFDVYTPPPGKGRPYITNANVKKIIDIHRNFGLQHETNPLC